MEILRWLDGKFGRVWDITQAHKGPKELPYRAFARTVGVDLGDLSRIRYGKCNIPERLQRNISRFIGLWENGLLEFKTTNRRKRFVSHLPKPKPMPARMTVVLDAPPLPTGKLPPPRLKILEKPRPPNAIFLTVKVK